jgi:uncharacterized membrane protein
MDLFFLYFMAAIYIFAGTMHFVNPKMYIRIIPPYMPNPVVLNAISGAFEIIFGIGLFFEVTRSISAIGIILLLLAVFLPIFICTKKDLKEYQNGPYSLDYLYSLF